MRVRYTGASDEQVRFGGADDPRKVLKVGLIYEVEEREEHSWYTRLHLKGVEGSFNSICFEEVSHD